MNPGGALEQPEPNVQVNRFNEIGYISTRRLFTLCRGLESNHKDKAQHPVPDE